MSVLEHPTAQALLADAEVSAATVSGCRRRLAGFLHRYLPRFYRVEQHDLARVVLEGKLSTLQRKTSEPIAVQAGRPRKPVQHFVGAGGWDDERVMAELRRHVSETLADPDAVLVLDPSAFPKSGADSCGVSRQWCGRLGKVENCQVGVFLAYVSAAGQALVDRRLYLPREWGPALRLGGRGRRVRAVCGVPGGTARAAVAVRAGRAVQHADPRPGRGAGRGPPPTAVAAGGRVGSGSAAPAVAEGPAG